MDPNMNPVEQARAIGQSIWLDNMRRGLLPSGELKRLVHIGVSGLTSNPTIFEKAIDGSNDYDAELADPVVACKDPREIYENLILEDIRSAADVLRPVYDRTSGEDGYASLEPNPDIAYDTEKTTAEVRRLWQALNRPNVFIKVPGTPQGMPVIRQLIGEGININITLIFSLDAYRQVRDAYIQGLEDLARKGGDVSKVASVASFFVSRVDTAVDKLLQEKIAEGREELKPLLGKAAIANSRLAYQAFKTTFSSRRFAELRTRGARVQRVLWASTSTKNPSYPDLMYVETLMGPNTIDTVPTATLNALLDHGRVRNAIEEDVEGADRTLKALDAAGIRMDQVTADLLAEGVKSFSESLHKLLGSLEEKRRRLLVQGVAHPSTSLGPLSPLVTGALADLKRRDVISRMWGRDHTVWKPDPTEIANRLGWMALPETMPEQVAALTDFAHEVVYAGFNKVVLLGMGGSSLGPEVARQVFGSEPGYPGLVVLDSTLPARIRSVDRAIDPAKTLFIVSSKSGGTIEPMSLYKHYRAKVEKAVGKGAGSHFVAITDAGTSLESLALASGFRRVFVNAPDIGGRYSVLSYFGLVPMALSGTDIRKLLARGERMCQSCASCVPIQANKGAWLGALLGTAALNRRDKLTLVCSPSIASFGLWLEQLVAESTGKEGRGIVPVAGEPLVSPDFYGNDRLFVYLRVEGDDNTTNDRCVEGIRAAGHPVVRLDLQDRYDLGAEFYRWEFGIAVAGSLLRINPFDQPNVQQSKDITSGMLEEYKKNGALAPVEAASGMQSVLALAKSGSYVAILAYVNPGPGIERAVRSLRRSLVEEHRVATTFGYGPRYLHSTGQLHKGGPKTGLFVQMVAPTGPDVPVPGESFTFGVLADAQARGDFKALKKAGRPVVRIELPSPASAGISHIGNGLKETVVPAGVKTWKSE